MDFELKVLGTSAALPAYGRFPSAQVLTVGNLSCLIDCGEGTQIRFQDFQVKTGKLRYVFISHLHGDHCYGLIGLLTTFNLTGRIQPLDIYAPAGLETMISTQLALTATALQFPVSFHEVDPISCSCILETSTIKITTLPLDHRVPCCGYLFEEQPRLRSMMSKYIEVFQLTVEQIKALKEGQDVVLENGTSVAADVVTIAPPPPRSYAYCADTAYKPELVPLLQGVDLLYHDCTFCLDHQERAADTGHSTAQQAAQIAKAAGVGTLVLGHFSSRYPDTTVFEEEAKLVFPPSVAARDGQVFRVPYQKRAL